MGLFGKQLANIVEWEQFNEDTIFWKWKNNEIKAGSRLIIKPGQDAIFLYNGKVEGVFEEDGDYDIESQIVPFLSTLKGFKFGFNSGMRAEVLFINTKEVMVKWGTKSAINIAAPGLPGGMPIRSFGTLTCKVADHSVLIEKVAGIKQQFGMEDVRERVLSMLDQLLMKWIAQEGRDMFNLQANAFEIGKGIQSDLDFEMSKIGLAITSFSIASFNYPEEIKKMQEKAAAQSMVGDMGRYTQMAMADSISKNAGVGSGMGRMATEMASMQMGMMMGQQMMNQMNPQNMQQSQQPAATSGMKFCPECGTKSEGAKFCSNCGTKLGS